MDISTRSGRTLVQDDQTWLGNGGEPIGKPRSIVLDRSAFDLDPDTGDFPDGYIKSGITLAKLTTTGLHVPYANAGANGAGTAVGRLFAAIPYDRESTADLGAALFWSGEVITDNLPAEDTADATALGQMTQIANV